MERENEKREKKRKKKIYIPKPPLKPPRPHRPVPPAISHHPRGVILHIEQHGQAIGRDDRVGFVV